MVATRIFASICIFVLGTSASYDWSHCEATVKEIRDGKTTVGPINNYTLPQYLYTGTVTGLVNDTIRNDPNQIRITYEGTYLPKPRPFLLPGFISNS